MITDLVQIKRLGDKKWDENMRFRRFVKDNSHSDGKLRMIAQEIEDQIDCKVCGNCCKVAEAGITERDVERLAKHLSMPVEKFRSEYTKPDPFDGMILQFSQEKGCVFLDGTLCSVYEARPDTCRRFPHLVRGNGSIARRMWSLVDRTRYCPIVYNSMEAFKDALHFRR